MNKEQKRAVIDEVKSVVQEIRDKTLIFVDFGRIKANNIANLRKEFKSAGIYYKVVKSDLLKIAFEELKIETNPTLFRGNVAMVLYPGDATEIAKRFVEVKDEDSNQVFKFKGGFVEGNWYDADKISALSKLPPKAILVAELLYLVKSPLSRLVTVLSKPQRDLVTVINQLKDKQTA